MSLFRTKQNTLLYCLLFNIFILSSIGCEENRIGPPSSTVIPANSNVYVPVYESQGLYTLTVEEIQPLQNPGKIFTYEHYLIVISQGKGFHVFNNADPKNPQALFFLRCPGVVDIAIKNNLIFADNYRDIVAFKIDSVNQVNVVKRFKDINPFQELDYQQYPPYQNVYFECPDPSKGMVIEWVKSDNTNVKCFRR